QFSSANFYKNTNNDNPVSKIKSAAIQGGANNAQAKNTCVYGKDSLLPYNLANIVPVRTQLETPGEKQMYSEILSALNSSQYSISAQDGVSIAKKLDGLLKSGKLLSSSSNDSSTTLKNLYD